MKNCLRCVYAEWEKTKSNKLHPSGEGLCKFPYKVKPLPSSMYFITEPHPSGGYINRKKELKENCIYYSPNSSAKVV